MFEATPCMMALKAGQLIVSVPSGPEGARAINRLRGEGGAQFGCFYMEALVDVFGDSETRSYVEGMPTQFHLIGVPAGDEASAINRIRTFFAGDSPSRGRITSVEPNALLSASAAIGVPFTLDHDHKAYLAQINFGSATSTGKDVRVAVIDSGLDATSGIGPPAMYDINVRPVAVVAPSDTDGHGTAMTTLIDAVAPGAEIVVVRAFDASGVLPCWNLMAAIPVAAFTCRADIVNMSLGFRSFPLACSGCGATQAARLNAYDLMLDGIENHPTYALDPPIYVAATGNDAATGGFDFPAFHDTSVAVGAINGRGSRSSFSNYGSVGHKQHVMAPGGEVVATTVTESVGHGPKGMLCHGTSVATAYVSGILAALRSDARYNWMTRAQFVATVLRSHTTLAAGQTALQYGRGLIHF